MTKLNRGCCVGPLVIVVLAISGPCWAQQEGADGGRPSPAKVERDNAQWADLEAQRRAADGDYDGAVQAHQQAEQELREARRLQTIEQGGR